MTHDPLTVACPDCAVPAAVPCHSRYGTHPNRTDRARWAAATEGTCDLCGQPLHRLTDPDTAVHLDTAHALACPPLPDPTTAWNDYARALRTGISPGHPGINHWHPLPAPVPHFQPAADTSPPGGTP